MIKKYLTFLRNNPAAIGVWVFSISLTTASILMGAYGFAIFFAVIGIGTAIIDLKRLK